MAAVSKPSNNSKHSIHTDDAKIISNKTICRLDQLTWFFGLLLIITGIVLFILDSFYPIHLYTSALIATIIGSTIFFFGIIFNCCVLGRCIGPIIDHLPNQSSSEKTKTHMPLSSEITTKNFFEERGVFGVPQDLIDEIDIWRKYKTTGNLSFDAGFILFGAPGTGKTTIAKLVAEILGGEYVETPCGALFTPDFGGTERRITDLFTVPKDQFRTVVIDEISGLLPKRKGVYWTDTLTEHFLGVVSGVTQKQPKYILIGTTNNIQAIDPALMRRGRLGKIFIIEYPNEETRIKIFNYHLSKITHSDEPGWEDLVRSLAKKTSNHSGSYIQGIISDAQKKALLAERPLKIEDFPK